MTSLCDCGLPTRNLGGICDVCDRSRSHRCPICTMRIGHDGLCDVCQDTMERMMKQDLQHPYYPCVKLKNDETFVGYVFGKCIDAQGNETGESMVSVSQPGVSGLRGCVRIANDRLAAIA